MCSKALAVWAPTTHIHPNVTILDLLTLCVTQDGPQTHAVNNVTRFSIRIVAENLPKVSVYQAVWSSRYPWHLSTRILQFWTYLHYCVTQDGPQTHAVNSVTRFSVRIVAESLPKVSVYQAVWSSRYPWHLSTRILKFWTYLHYCVTQDGPQTHVVNSVTRFSVRIVAENLPKVSVYQAVWSSRCPWHILCVNKAVVWEDLKCWTDSLRTSLCKYLLCPPRFISGFVMSEANRM